VSKAGRSVGFSLEDVEAFPIQQLVDERRLGRACLAAGHAARLMRRSLWTDALPANWAALDKVHNPPQAVELIAIPDVEMRSDYTGYVGDAPICAPLLYPGYVQNYYADGTIEQLGYPDSGDVRVHDGPAYVITHFNIMTYGHFLLEIMPKLFAIKVLYQCGYAFPIVFPKSASMYAPVLKAIHDQFEVLFYQDRTERLRLLLGLFPSALASASQDLHDMFSTAVQTFARSTFADLKPKRIFISRQGRRSFRVLSNEAALWEIAAGHGFEIVKPEELAFIDQVRLFANASHVIGEFTSALHNVVFSPSSTNVMGLHWINRIQSRIADATGQGIGYILAADGRWPRLVHGWKEPDNFRIDEGEFKERIAEFVVMDGLSVKPAPAPKRRSLFPFWPRPK
jgi:capsular polysaccharide biosynthesis protein